MNEVKITIEGEGLSLVKYTTLQKAGQIISFLGHEQESVAAGSPSQIQPSLIGTRLQPRDIINNSGAKTYPQKIAALAKYLRDNSGQNTFSPQEIRLVFKKMGDEPKNFTRDFSKAIEIQYILCTDTVTDQYELTDRGDDAVQNGFVEEVNNGKKTANPKKNTSKKNVRDEVINMEIVGSLENYPDYHGLPTKGDKILWLLEYAFKKDFKALSPAEIDYLSTGLRDRVEAGGFTALNARNVKNAFVAKAAEGFQIQKKGSDYIKNLANKNENKA